MNEPAIFGARAEVLIRFDGDIRALAEKLSGVLITTIDVEPAEYPPYEDIGMGETLGWDLWLEKAGSETGNFKLRLETESSVEEIWHGRMHDLSPWLARHLSIVGNLEVIPAGRG